MWFSNIHARAFGPIENQSLKFEKGLNVVHGSNESGKSSWHAAITVALCGLRRSAGRTKADREFEARHRPWDGGEDDAWFVQAGVMLDDGRHIEIDRDLDNRMTNVRRADLGGRQFTDLPISDGSPDGSRLLGLDRQTFPMTASVRQASIVADLREPDALQQHLARAAAGSTGGTAAGAIERIDAYSREHVGLDRRNSIKPLRAAKNGMEAAEANLSAVRNAHRNYLDLASSLDEHRREIMSLRHRRARAEAQRDHVSARHEAERLSKAATQIDEWEERFSTGDPSQQEVVGPVALSDALARVESLPDPESTSLATATDLESQLREMDSHKDLPCPELRDVQQCVEPLRRLDPPESDNVAAATPRAKAAIPALIATIAVGAVASALNGAGAGLSAAVIAGVVVLLVALAVRRVKARSTRQSQLWSSHESESAARNEAVHRLSEWQLPLDPDDAVREASNRLQAQTDRSASRRQLERDLEHRREFDEAEARRRRRHKEAWTRLRRFASERGLEGSDQEVRHGAQAVIAAHEAAQRQRDDEIQEWGRYQQALNGRTPQHWRDEAAAARAAENACQERLNQWGVELAAPTSGTSGPEAEVAGLDRAIREASRRADQAEGALGKIDQNSVDVAAAEARLSEAGVELDRVERLADTLDTTSGFLERAAEKAHMLVAPRLAEQMSPWIPKVTNGRYARVEVDPGDLCVTLVTAAGERRNAQLVSRGTTEQVYLVLRLVLAQVLSADHEACPVLLDDPTVHADAGRKNEMLDYLLAASKQHQVILFSQEQEVLDWARQQPSGAVHLIELPEPQPA